MRYYDYIGNNAFDIFIFFAITAMVIGLLTCVYVAVASKTRTIKETTTIIYGDGSRVIYEKRYKANVHSINNK